MEKNIIRCHTAEYSFKNNDDGMTLRFYNFKINYLTFLKLKRVKGIKTIRRNSGRRIITTP